MRAAILFMLGAVGCVDDLHTEIHNVSVVQVSMASSVAVAPAPATTSAVAPTPLITDTTDIEPCMADDGDACTHIGRQYEDAGDAFSAIKWYRRGCRLASQAACSAEVRLGDAPEPLDATSIPERAVVTSAPRTVLGNNVTIYGNVTINGDVYLGSR